ncbi:MAG: DUF362 domain-containing protein [candidate division WOR-3 bacterium]
MQEIRGLATCIADALDFLDYQFAGQRVWVKPNLLGPHPPERAVTTDPELVRLVVGELKKRGARSILVGDNPGGSLHGDLASFIAPTGVIEASAGCFANVGRESFELPLRSRFVSSIRASGVLREVDVLINLPVFKTHALTVLTGAIKNIFGVVVGGQKTALHALAPGCDDFSELLVDIYQGIPVPMLHIMDAIRGMDGRLGPSAGRALRINRILAARNGVALDAVMALMAGIEPDQFPMVRIARERGLGPSDASCIEIIGDFSRIAGFRLPRRVPKAAAGLTRAVYRLLVRQPSVNSARCTRCGQCQRSCPVRAIRLKPLPVVDARKCLLCYCCVETCPEQAMRIPSQFENLLPRFLSAVQGRFRA